MRFLRALATGLVLVGTLVSARAEVTLYQSWCDDSTNFYKLQFYNWDADAVDLNVCVVTNGQWANNYYQYVYGQSYSQPFTVGTCEKSYQWWWTDDGSIPYQCR